MLPVAAHAAKRSSAVSLGARETVGRRCIITSDKLARDWLILRKIRSGPWLVWLQSRHCLATCIMCVVIKFSFADKQLLSSRSRNSHA